MVNAVASEEVLTGIQIPGGGGKRETIPIATLSGGGPDRMTPALRWV